MKIPGGIYLGLLYRQFDKEYLASPKARLSQLAAIPSMPAADFADLWRSKLADKFS